MATNNAINEAGFPWPASQGGTGRNTLTAHGVLVGNNTSAITSLAVGTNGQPLIGSTGVDPQFSSLTDTAGSLTYTTGAHALNVDIANWNTSTNISSNVVFNFSTGSNSTFTSRTGFASRVGNIVYFGFNFVTSALGSGTATAQVLVTTGLGNPSTTSTPWIQAVYFKNIAWTGTINFYAQADGAILQIFFFTTLTTGVKSNLAKAAFTNPVTMAVSGWYYTAP